MEEVCFVIVIEFALETEIYDVYTTIVTQVPHSRHPFIRLLRYILDYWTFLPLAPPSIGPSTAGTMAEAVLDSVSTIASAQTPATE